MTLVPIFLNDLEDLHDLTECPKFPIYLVQSKQLNFLHYIFGDSSEIGFVLSLNGSKFGLEIHVGTWNEQGS